MSGILLKPKPQGKARLRGGQFDVVGQGVFQDVSLDATFSPKEAVVDRLSGTMAGGTFSAILVASLSARCIQVAVVRAPEANTPGMVGGAFMREQACFPRLPIHDANVVDGRSLLLRVEGDPLSVVGELRSVLAILRSIGQVLRRASLAGDSVQVIHLIAALVLAKDDVLAVGRPDGLALRFV